MKPIFKNRKRNKTDLGFGAIAEEKGRKRLINRDGSFNVKRNGLKFYQSLSLYHALLDMSWTKFFAYTAIGYILMNTAFAILYLLLGNSAISGNASENFYLNFLNAFFFSVQTSSTIGYGNLIPGNIASNIVVSIESFVGILSVAIITGLLFARFSKPTAKIIFSKKALIAPFHEKKAFMFRIVNARKNQLFEMEIELNLILDLNVDGKIERKPFKLNLEISRLTFFPLSWTIVHPIDDNSPLYNLELDEFRKANPEFYIFLKGVDDTFNQYVYTRSSYTLDEIIYGAKFDTIYVDTQPHEHTTIDISLLDNYKMIEFDSEGKK